MNWELFNQLPIVGILRGFSEEQTKGLVQACLEGGLVNIEITMNTQGASDLIKHVNSIVGDKMNVGAGTVCSMDDLKLALDSDAQYIVTPITNPEVITYCKENSIPIFAGAFSPTEIHQAWSLGADMVKVFPSDVLGAKYIKALKAPLNDIKLMPTGGVDPDTISDFKAAGASAYGVGSPLFNKEKVEAGDFPWLIEQINKFKSAYKE